MPEPLTRLVDALIAHVQTEQPAHVEYVLHLPVSVALRLPGVRPGLVDSRLNDLDEVTSIRGLTYRGLEVVSWSGAGYAEKVTASPLLTPGDASAPVYILDLITGTITVR